MMARLSSFSGIFKGRLEDEAEYVLLGLPYDAGSSFRPGTRLAPAQIRQMAESLSPCTERGLDLSALPALDLGDLSLGNRAPLVFEQIKTRVGGIFDRNAVPILLGGDHSITVPCFAAALSRYPGLRLLYLDAHPDLYPDYQGDTYSHACVVARILELQGMTGESVTQVGIRAVSPQQLEVAQRAGIRLVPSWEADSFCYAEEGPVYLSVDIDVLDPAYAPGCGNPVPSGLSSRWLLSLIQGLRAKIVALDVVEVNPLIDPAGITALAAVRVVTEALGTMAALERARALRRQIGARAGGELPDSAQELNDLREERAEGLHRLR